MRRSSGALDEAEVGHEAVFRGEAEAAAAYLRAYRLEVGVLRFVEDDEEVAFASVVAEEEVFAYVFDLHAFDQFHFVYRVDGPVLHDFEFYSHLGQFGADFFFRERHCVPSCLLCEIIQHYSRIFLFFAGHS